MNNLFLHILLCSILTSWSNIGPCSNLKLSFGTSSSLFADCLSKNIKPVHICVACAEKFQSVNESYFNITADKNCTDELLDSDNAMVIRRLFDAYLNMWVHARCSTCSGLSSNISEEFKNETDETLRCFRKHNKTQVCDSCRERYNNLTSLFKNLQEKGFVCADLADSMNSTAASWSVGYHCDHLQFEYLPVLSMTCGILLLPLSFYLLLSKF